MAFRRSDWPLTLDQLRGLIVLGETALVEFKREWWNLSTSEGKARLAREVMALANTVGPEELGIIVFGIDDERRGRSVVPVIDPPEPEAIIQILQPYVHPPASIACRHFAFPEGLLSALAVLHSPARPHYTSREHPQILSPRDVYVRRDHQVGVLTPPELERLIREKDASLRIAPEPIQYGFVNLEEVPPQEMVFRIMNVVTEPVFGVSLTVDVSLLRDPSVCGRFRFLTNATLQAGEIREMVFDVGQIHMYRTTYEGSPARAKTQMHRDCDLESDHWRDLVAHLSFRDSDGIIRQRQVTLALA